MSQENNPAAGQEIMVESSAGTVEKSASAVARVKPATDTHTSEPPVNHLHIKKMSGPAVSAVFITNTSMNDSAAEN